MGIENAFILICILGALFAIGWLAGAYWRATRDTRRYDSDMRPTLAKRQRVSKYVGRH